VTVDDTSRVTGFIEKPEIPQSDLVSMGIYVFNKQVLIDRLIEDAALPSSPHDFGHAVMPRMVKRYNVSAYNFQGYWRDIGTPQVYYESNMELLPHAPSFVLNGNWPVLTEPNHLAPPRISPQGSVQNSIISPGCVIKGHVVNSVLSPGVWVEEEATVRDSVIMANSFIGYHTVIDHCVLSEGVNVGRLCYLGFGSSVAPAENITVVGDDATVPPHTAIGRNCRILPHTGLGDFTGTVVPSDSVMSPQPARKILGIEDGEAGNISKRLRAY
jgi:glucose-1-phosphate adenylyltransferase